MVVDRGPVFPTEDGPLNVPEPYRTAHAVDPLAQLVHDASTGGGYIPHGHVIRDDLGSEAKNMIAGHIGLHHRRPKPR